MNEKRGSWIATWSGKKLDVYDPDPDEICIEDIAHALSLSCRYGGHTTKHYSVAQHSIIMEKHILFLQDALGLADDEQLLNVRRWALLHDAAEAYLGDLPRPIKRAFPNNEFKQIELRLMEAIAEKFGLEGTQPELVSYLDHNMVADEAKALFPYEPEWVKVYEPIGLGEIVPWSPEIAEEAFLSIFEVLFHESE